MSLSTLFRYISAGMIVVSFSFLSIAQSTEQNSDDVCAIAIEAFSAYSEFVTVSCDEDYTYVHTLTGLPEESPENPLNKMMVGITNWILRMPVPFTYDWKIPTNPTWLSEIYQEATAKGPMAFAVNGVPIFHLERRPDVSTAPHLYDPHSDTALQGELDQCGGHAGQGEDYHYHYAPVCLLDDHDLSSPIAYGLDGVPIYFGTGGTDYYGSGRFNNLNNLPEDGLDECNAYQNDDGSYAYYTTTEAPYTIGCHRAFVDESLRIEPRPFRNQGDSAPYGGRIGEASETLVTDYYVDENGWRHLEHQSFEDSGMSATLFRESDTGSNCWDFEFRANSTQSGTVQTYCR